MTRRSLSPVPDAPRSGVDLGELRRNLAPAAPAPLQAVQTSPAGPQAAADARAALSEAHIALRDAVDHRNRCEARRVELLDREAIGTSRSSRLEADLARALGSGDAPAARQAREALEDLAVEMHPLAESGRQADADYQRACNAVERAQVALRQAALAVIAADFDGLLERWVTASKAAIATENEARALIGFLQQAGYGDAWSRDALIATPIRRLADAQLVKPVRMRYADEEAAARAPYIQSHAARLERLLAGEEQE